MPTGLSKYFAYVLHSVQALSYTQKNIAFHQVDISRQYCSSSWHEVEILLLRWIKVTSQE